MSRNVPLPRIARFTDDYVKELALFEQAVATKLREDDRQEHGPFTITDRKRSIYTPKPWEIVEIDPSDAPFPVVFPDPGSALCRGAWIGLKNCTDSVNAVTLSTIAGSIDGQAVSVLSSPRFFQWFFSNGSDWQRGPSHTERLLPTIATHTADANTVALWQGDRPGTSSSGLVDSSGNGFTLEAVGSAGFGEIGLGQEGFAFDGLGYFRRAGSVNDALLNATFQGNYTIEALVRVMQTPAGYTVFDYGGLDGAHGGASDADHDCQANLNLKAAGTGGTTPAVPNSAMTAHFYETGAASPHSSVDTKIYPFNQVQHIAVVVSGLVLTFFVNGFRQSSIAVLARNALTTPHQFVHIGADHNGQFPFFGYLASVKVSNVARSDDYIRADAGQCLGFAHRGAA